MHEIIKTEKPKLKSFTDLFILIYIYIYIEREGGEREVWGVCGIVVAVEGNEHGDSGSNPELSCLHFTYL